MKMKNLNSSNIKRIGYDAELHLMTVEFHRRDGVAIYSYPDTSLKIFEGMLTAESPGKYFNEHIRGKPFIKS